MFVRDLYTEPDARVTVERDVTEVGKSEARRQVDVKVVQTTRLHALTIIVECKRWKEAVSRDRIDVLAAAVEDLGASKGVMFTTKGFEEGAVCYAKAKNIDSTSCAT